MDGFRFESGQGGCLITCVAQDSILVETAVDGFGVETCCGLDPDSD